MIPTYPPELEDWLLTGRASSSNLVSIRIAFQHALHSYMFLARNPRMSS